MKTRSTSWFLTPLAAAALSVGAALPAEAQQSGLVNVNLEDIAIDIADVLDVNENQIPVTVQVPVGIAANVCEVNANVLAQQRREEEGANCTARNTSTALNRIVQRQIRQEG